ncbi:MAG TPA: glycosyltransferase [Pirellulaceae bacterium]
MRISLSFVFPVHNAESTLAGEVRTLLDLLADLGVGFEFLVIDDGSTDDTLGEARELERRFAQVRVIHRPLRYGHSSAVQLGLKEAVGRNVMVYNDRVRGVTSEIHDLWQARLGSGTPRTVRRPLATAFRQNTKPYRVTDYGSILEMGGLILVQRWKLADLSHVEDFVRSDVNVLEPLASALDAAFAEPLPGPHYLSTAGLAATQSSW